MIHASRTIGETLLPQWLASFRVNAPACLSVAITNSDEVMHAVRGRAAEIGFVEGPAGGIDGLTELLVGHDELRVVVAADHPWARRRAISPKPLTQEPFLAREAGSGTRSFASTALAAKGVELEPALGVSSARSSSARCLPEGSRCFQNAQSRRRSRGAHAIPVSGVELRRALRAVRRSRPALQGPARGFWLWLERTVALLAQ